MMKKTLITAAAVLALLVVPMYDMAGAQVSCNPNPTIRQETDPPRLAAVHGPVTTPTTTTTTTSTTPTTTTASTTSTSVEGNEAENTTTTTTLPPPTGQG